MSIPFEHHGFPSENPVKFQNPGMALTAINSIDNVIQIKSDVNVVLDQLMDVVLGIFNSSRAWLFHPCNPKLPYFAVTFESTTPEYPGANTLNQQVPMTDDMADYCRRALSAIDGPEIDPSEGQPITNDIAIRFNVKSMLFMALRPKSGEPWMFGLHQCDRDRVWSSDEKQLFYMIGQRITICIDNLLYVRQIRENEALLNYSQQLSSIGSFVWDLKTDDLQWSKNMYRIHGIDENTFEENLTDIWQRSIHPDDQYIVRSEINRMIEAGHVWNMDFRIIRSDGEERIIRSSGEFTIDKSGKPIKCIGVHQDITGHKKSENALRESVTRYDELVANVPVGVYVFWMRATGHLEFEFVSDRWCEIHQVKREDVLSDATNVNNLVHPDDRDDFLVRNQESFLERIPFVWEGRFLIGGGKFRWLRIESTPIVFDNADSRWFGVTWDITDRKQAEEALRESEKKLRTTLNATPFPIAIVDLQDDKIFFWSRSAVELFGHTARTASEWYQMAYPDPDYRQVVIEEWKPVLEKARKSGQTVNTGERRITCKDGSECLCEIYATFLPENLILTFNNITDRKKADVEREKLQIQLNQAQKLESVGRLAGGVAHDFNNMLGVILGHTELALLQTDKNHELHDDLKEIQKAAKRSADITKQLLAFARKDIISPKSLELNDTVESMLNMLRRLIGENIDLVWQPAAHLWPVKMDPSQVDQILANLCLNARDAITGVGKLIIETGKKSFDEEYCKEHPGFIPGDFVLLAVSDNGCGMDKETLDNLFEPFFTTKEVGKGTGLGLATIYGIIKQNNGFINVYSEPGQGSTFKIYLPRLFEDNDFEKVLPQKKSSAGGTETILLVDDDPSLLHMTQMMLERKGYSVLFAKTPTEALERAKLHTGSIDLLMTDVIMPEMNGRDLAGHMRGLYSDIKALFMSGYTADIIDQHGVLDDGVTFIQKPFSLVDLAETVREALDTAQ